MITHKRLQEIIAMFHRSKSAENQAEIDTVSLSELRDADALMGTRDVYAQFRTAIRYRIADLDLLEQRHHESTIRAWNLVAGVFIGLVVAGLSVFLFGCASQ